MQKARLWQVDFLRGLAIVLMILFNWSFTLNFLDIIVTDSSFLYWWLFPRFIGASFIIIAGISLALSYEKVKHKFFYKKYLFRGAKIFGLGLLITLATHLSFPQQTIWFGILHLIGLSIIISIPFLRLYYSNLIIGLSVLLIGSLLQTTNFTFPHLLWLGFTPLRFTTFDYFPLLPWAGFLFIGLFLGKRFAVKIRPTKYRAVLMPFLGRHSLIIYIVHQPLLLLALFLLGFITI